jgi:putative hemolysin
LRPLAVVNRLRLDVFRGGLTVVLSLVAVAAVAACADSSKDPQPSAEDERGSVGVPNPAADYCEKIGYTLTADSKCVFPDGTSCEEWSFYRGSCGQPNSYCNRHGGAITSEESDAGGFTSVQAICHVDGKQCAEEDFYQSGTCN